MVPMGRITGAFGVQGWVKIHPYSDDPAGFPTLAGWMIGQDPSWREVDVVQWEVHSSSVVAKLRGVDDRDAAAVLRGQELAVPRESLPPAAEGEFYWSDLVGLAVVNGVGEALGEVAEVFSNGAQEVLRVQDGTTERLIPFVPAYVQEVRPEAGRMVVDWQRDW